ncbi:MAG: NADH-quinone oxidoreductase chain 3 [Alphaproteobacteria bacterium MarineAlpha5_Bin9]|nr:MAG: NADH-quinone oxidoreductase chain 3 [Alphaproteobacteria bacterium MarineAlpha5_Bin9]|tara:strand:+ start:129 stop:2171 length:2043 start_codon:yes stop_codon:yes gene_type:complete
MPKILIDNNEIEFKSGMTVLQACEIAGKEIPRFCYHDRLSIAGNCRMCLVEIEKSTKPIASCAMPAQEGMKIKTNSELIKKARQGVMEFLLINHPLDCPICDQGGECDLQDQALYYGLDKSRFEENKRAVTNKYMGPLVSTIMTRCIHCTRCVRFASEVAGVDDLGMLGRGENVEITTFLEKTIKSELSGNVIDLCPVGALTSKPYAFQARPWELKKTETIDVFDAMGSSIRIDSKGKTVYRVLPRLNESINEEWINDKSRFSFDGLSRQRIDVPYIKKHGKLIETSWDEAIRTIIFELNNRSTNYTTAISGKFTDVETLYSSKKFLNSLNSNFYDCRFDNTQLKINKRESYLYNTSISKTDLADTILIIGSNPKWEASVLNSRIRKAYLNNDCKIGLIGKKIDLTYKYTHLSDTLDYLNSILDGSSPFCNLLKKASRPMIIIGNSAIDYENGEDILDVCSLISKKYNLIKNDWNGFNVLQQDISRVGALDIGFYNNKFSKNFDKNLSQHLSAHRPLVFLLNQDEIQKDIFKDSFVVYLGHHGEASAEFADILLPVPAYTEKSSTFVNMEGRVMQSNACYSPIGEAKEEWKIFRALTEFFGKKLNFNNLTELRLELCNENKIFKELNVLPNINSLDFGNKKLILKRSFEYNIKNFYMNDIISRSSINMANCSKEILNQVE